MFSMARCTTPIVTGRCQGCKICTDKFVRKKEEAFGDFHAVVPSFYQFWVPMVLFEGSRCIEGSLIETDVRHECKPVEQPNLLPAGRLYSFHAETKSQTVREGRTRHTQPPRASVPVASQCRTPISVAARAESDAG